MKRKRIGVNLMEKKIDSQVEKNVKLKRNGSDPSSSCEIS
jgi:hypothetical protein